jgi:YD repeat-containing protein
VHFVSGKALFAVSLALAFGFHLAICLASANPDGASVGYEYDPLNRLAAVNDTHLGRTSYGYDGLGNLRKRGQSLSVTH